MNGSPEQSSAQLVAKLADASDYVIAADRGAEVLRRANRKPDVFCGDADSATDGAARWAHGLAHTDIRFPSEKYATDLALALDCARHEAARQDARLHVTVTCASGGRPDHLLAVFGLLARSADASPHVVEDAFECHVLSPDGESAWQLGSEPGAQGATFSTLALAEDTVVSEHGVKWELDQRRLAPLDDLGISNVVTSPEAEVFCHSGVLAVFLIRS